MRDIIEKLLDRKITIHTDTSHDQDNWSIYTREINDPLCIEAVLEIQKLRAWIERNHQYVPEAKP